jgi:hypothetical protein
MTFAGIQIGLGLAGMWMLIRGARGTWYGILALMWWLNVVWDLSSLHFPLGVLVTGPMAIYYTWKWWNSWKDKRRKALALIGAKSRALRDRLVSELDRRRVPGGRTLPVPA